ncbi:MAG TPA: hypothetical protein DEG17_23820 [Cyanobacteria bacterium UBA11149]|nr:hypothetical protein [Cyanobacteria bacterium UBA11367]HBE60830.1 hypothetical protein [Cyanobacteria bacterium UBA11366]HBK66804.1 hypothetical protein [Cyanobacteria bacterium UBA11166]HBR74202.1 hypothetical protein [Cyanobacteria bacterium UBA11159]HBS70442.1 hypothetical protein [Cyanobacteria bacterium UBA11153]HBW91810.1 hypothetical protein [Cyanobacteria bacterium UBA11149]HCA94163.1 hypothetical protein [Cyanobacteria bacterium UBA9226]
MNKSLTAILALSLSIASPTIATAKQIVTPITSENSATNLTNQGDNISKISLSSPLNNEQLIAQSVARLNFSWSTAHNLELAAVAMEFILTAKTGDFAVLAVLLASGHDIYMVRVRLENTGNVPLRVYPQNIKAYYGNTSTRVISMPDNRFLQPDTLQPGYYIDKPVIFIAPYGLNLQRDIQIGYGDNSIQVTYD